MKLFILVLLMPMLSFAQVNTWKDNVDGLDLWEIKDPSQVQTAITDFKVKCAGEIIERTKKMIDEVGVSSDDFQYKTRVHSKVYEGYGKAYICELKITAMKNSHFHFSKPSYSPDFFDIIDPNTNEVIKTNVEQCKEFSHELEMNARVHRIFNRHALLVWRKNPRNGKFVEACFVKYSKLIVKK